MRGRGRTPPAPAPHGEELTVDDILSAEQDPSAAGDPDAAAEAESPYLGDLRRITAEYANYRKRTEANAVIEKQRAVAAAVLPMLPVLDDLDRASSGDLEEGTAFSTIATKIRTFSGSVSRASARRAIPSTRSCTRPSRDCRCPAPSRRRCSM